MVVAPRSDVKIRAPIRCWAPLALALMMAACGSDPTQTIGSDASRDPQRPALPPEGAGASALPGQSGPEAIARASANDLARAPNDVDWSGGNSGHGKTLFANDCSLCHGGSGKGDGLATPAINPKPRDFTTGRFYIDASANNQTGEDVDLARVILYGPGAFGGSNAMSAWRDQLSDDDVRDLIAYIRTFVRPGTETAKRPRANEDRPRS